MEIDKIISDIQIHNDYINCLDIYPINIKLNKKEIIQRDLLILQRSVEYCKTKILIDDY
jgi:hypothetical protein